jgi:hypothetical protein
MVVLEVTYQDRAFFIYCLRLFTRSSALGIVPISCFEISTEDKVSLGSWPVNVTIPVGQGTHSRIVAVNVVRRASAVERHRRYS